jgi:hypothetical protein
VPVNGLDGPLAAIEILMDRDQARAIGSEVVQDASAQSVQ